MSERIESELALLRTAYPALEYRPDGRWVRIASYVVPVGIWSQAQIEICFQIPTGIPGEAPYGFYVRPHLTLANGRVPNNYTYPAPTVFGQDWGKFSWILDPWTPQADVRAGSNMLDFALSIHGRLKEGA